VRTERRLLFVSPAVPAEGGNGLAVRAGLFLDALAADHAVTLLVVPVSGPPPGAAWTPFVVARTAGRACLDLAGREDPAFPGAATSEGARSVAALRAYPRPLLARFGPASVEAARRMVGPAPFDLVHVLRLYLAPFVEAAPGTPRAVLDLDDDEVETRRRLAALHAARGEAAGMTLEAAEAEKYREIERAWLGRFDELLVCSERDRRAVAARTGHVRVAAIPNGVRAEPAGSAGGPRDPEDRVFRLLFVGTLGYAPNEDAAATLCHEILPRLRAAGPVDVRVDLVGARPSAAVAELARLDGVSLHANVPDVAPFYARAGAAVMPLRAGGGTRIKLLEAFARGVPVVSTALGAEGLEVEAGRHLLVADDADGLAAACRRLMTEPALAGRLRTEARRLVARRYDAARVREAIRARYLGGPEPA